MTEYLGHQTNKYLWLLGLFVTTLIGYVAGVCQHVILVRCDLRKLSHYLQSPWRPDSTGHVQDNLNEETEIVLRLIRRGAVREASDCLTEHVMNSNRLCRHRAIILFLDLDEGTIFALRQMRQIAVDPSMSNDIRDDAEWAIELIENRLIKLGFIKEISDPTTERVYQPP